MHPDKAELDRLLPYIAEFQRLASKHGIEDVFQDNGGKLLQTLLVLNLRGLPGREGNDAVDPDGNELELKTANINLVTGFSTHHHLNPTILAKYRQVVWYFSLYRNIELIAIYRLTPDQLEPYFGAWETKWAMAKKDINNRKIPIGFVVDRGALVHLSTGATIPAYGYRKL